MGNLGVRVPYLRQTSSGFYWEPSRRLRAMGFRSRPLGQEVTAAVEVARVLNQEAERAIAGTAERLRVRAPGTMGAVIAHYLASRRFAGLAASTQRSYRQCLERIEDRFGERRPEAITRPVVKVWQEQLEARAPAFAAAILRVLRVAMKHAKNMGHKIDLGDYKELDLHTARGAGAPWEDCEISAYCDEAKRQGRPEMALALMLGVCLGQREGDILALPRSAYDPVERTISLRQHKTGTTILVPVLPELRREIETAPVRGTIFVVSKKGRPYKEHHFRHAHRRICRAAGIPDERQFRLLRHTAATRLGEAGCSDDLIRAVTGHLDRGVVARYVRPNSVMATAAIERLQAHRDRVAREQNRGRDGK